MIYILKERSPRVLGINLVNTEVFADCLQIFSDFKKRLVTRARGKNNSHFSYSESSVTYE